MIGWIGERAIAGYGYLASLATLASQAFLDFATPEHHGRRESFRVIGRQILFTGVDALPVTSVIALLLGILIITQAGTQLPRLGAGGLDYSRASLKRVDSYLAGYLRSHSTMQTDPQLFQELTAYYGETLRRAVGGEWRVREDEVSKYPEPNIIISGGGAKEIKPWSGLVTILYDEEKRGAGLTKLFDADIAAAR